MWAMRKLAKSYKYKNIALVAAEISSSVGALFV